MFNNLSATQTEAGVRLKVLTALKEYPEIVLTQNQLRFESNEILISRLHACKFLVRQNSAASKIQAMVMAFFTRRAYKELR